MIPLIEFPVLFQNQDPTININSVYFIINSVLTVASSNNCCAFLFLRNLKSKAETKFAVPNKVNPINPHPIIL